MTQQNFPQLTNTPMIGDADLMQESIAVRDTREGRRGTRRKQDTSLYTRAVREASEYGEKLRHHFRSDSTAPLMKRKLTRAQVRDRIMNMPPEKKMALAKKFGRPFIELAAQITGEEK
jgi:hypothetical protein